MHTDMVKGAATLSEQNKTSQTRFPVQLDSFQAKKARLPAPFLPATLRSALLFYSRISPNSLIRIAIEVEDTQNCFASELKCLPP